MGQRDRPGALTADPIRIGGNSSLEIRDDYIDSIEDPVKARPNFIFNDVANNSALETYAKGKLVFHFHIGIRRAGIFGNYCIVFNSVLDGGVRDRYGHGDR